MIVLTIPVIDIGAIFWGIQRLLSRKLQVWMTSTIQKWSRPMRICGMSTLVRLWIFVFIYMCYWCLLGPLVFSKHLISPSIYKEFLELREEIRTKRAAFIAEYNITESRTAWQLFWDDISEHLEGLPPKKASSEIEGVGVSHCFNSEETCKLYDGSEESTPLVGENDKKNK